MSVNIGILIAVAVLAVAFLGNIVFMRDNPEQAKAVRLALATLLVLFCLFVLASVFVSSSALAIPCAVACIILPPVAYIIALRRNQGEIDDPLFRSAGIHIPRGQVQSDSSDDERPGLSALGLFSSSSERPSLRSEAARVANAKEIVQDECCQRAALDMLSDEPVSYDLNEEGFEPIPAAIQDDSPWQPIDTATLADLGETQPFRPVAVGNGKHYNGKGDFAVPFDESKEPDDQNPWTHDPVFDYDDDPFDGEEPLSQDGLVEANGIEIAGDSFGAEESIDLEEPLIPASLQRADSAELPSNAEDGEFFVSQEQISPSRNGRTKPLHAKDDYRPSWMHKTPVEPIVTYREVSLTKEPQPDIDEAPEETAYTQELEAAAAVVAPEPKAPNTSEFRAVANRQDSSEAFVDGPEPQMVEAPVVDSISEMRVSGVPEPQMPAVVPVGAADAVAKVAAADEESATPAEVQVGGVLEEQEIVSSKPRADVGKKKRPHRSFYADMPAAPAPAPEPAGTAFSSSHMGQMPLFEESFQEQSAVAEPEPTFAPNFEPSVEHEQPTRAFVADEMRDQPVVAPDKEIVASQLSASIDNGISPRAFDETTASVPIEESQVAVRPVEQNSDSHTAQTNEAPQTFEPEVSVPDPVPELSPLDKMIKKAEALETSGMLALAARLYRDAAEMAPNSQEGLQLRLKEVTCFVKLGDLDHAKEIAAEMKKSKVLTKDIRVKLIALEKMK